jgi:hypothetical protein
VGGGGEGETKGEPGNRLTPHVLQSMLHGCSRKPCSRLGERRGGDTMHSAAPWSLTGPPHRTSTITCRSSMELRLPWVANRPWVRLPDPWHENDARTLGTGNPSGTSRSGAPWLAP